MLFLYIILGIVGIIVLLLLICCIRAALLKPAVPRGSAPPVDEARAAKYAEDLAALIQCQTVNAPDIDAQTTRAAFAAMRAALARRFPLAHKNMKQTLLGDALLMHWQGADSTRPAILLMAHSDVVPATGNWQHPPFAGKIADECIWGRGTMDTKGSLCAMFAAVEDLMAEGFTPPVDVYIASSNNEETMGDGAPNIRDYLVAQGVELAIVSDEGGAVVQAPLPGLAGNYAMLGIVEKGFANLRFVATSGGGHASTPPKNTPLARLAAFVNEVERRPPFRAEISPPVREMFAALAPYMSFPFRLLLGNLWLFGPLVKSILPKVSSQAGAMLRTTCAFTMAQGSPAANVIPETASVTANLRFIMHQPMQESIEAIRQVANKYGLETVVEYAHDCSPYVDTACAQYTYMVRCVRETFPEAGVAPYVILGGTDARHFAALCPCTLRFAPTILTKQQLASMHGLDENLGVTALARAVEFYTRLVRNYSPALPA